MPVFLLGLFLGGLSGGVTYWLSADNLLSLTVGVIAAVLTWIGIATIIFADS